MNDCLFWVLSDILCHFKRLWIGETNKLSGEVGLHQISSTLSEILILSETLGVAKSLKKHRQLRSCQACTTTGKTSGGRSIGRPRQNGGLDFRRTNRCQNRLGRYIQLETLQRRLFKHGANQCRHQTSLSPSRIDSLRVQSSQMFTGTLINTAPPSFRGNYLHAVPPTAFARIHLLSSKLIF